MFLFLVVGWGVQNFKVDALSRNLRKPCDGFLFPKQPFFSPYFHFFLTIGTIFFVVERRWMVLHEAKQEEVDKIDDVEMESFVTHVLLKMGLQIAKDWDGAQK